LSPCSSKARIASAPGEPPGSRVAVAAIPARPSAATSRATWVDFPAPSPPSTVMNLPRALSGGCPR